MERLLKFNSWFHSLYGQKRILPWFSLELLHGIFLLLFLRTQPDWNYMLWILVTFSSPAWRNLLNYWLQFRNDYYNSCFRLYFFLFSVGNTFKLFLARQQFWHWCLRTYLLYNACTDHHCSTGMHLGGHLFTCTYYVVVTLEIGSACTMSCAISRKYIQQHATSLVRYLLWKQ